MPAAGHLDGGLPMKASTNQMVARAAVRALAALSAAALGAAGCAASSDRPRPDGSIQDAGPVTDAAAHCALELAQVLPRLDQSGADGGVARPFEDLPSGPGVTLRVGGTATGRAGTQFVWRWNVTF